MKNFILFFSICIFLLECKGENNQLIEQETIKVPAIYGTWKSVEKYHSPGDNIIVSPITYSCTYTFKEDGSVIYNRESFSCKGKYFLYEDTSYHDLTDTDTLVAIKDLECDIVDFNCSSSFFHDYDPSYSYSGPIISFRGPVTMILNGQCIEICAEIFEKVGVDH